MLLHSFQFYPKVCEGAADLAGFEIKVYGGGPFTAVVRRQEATSLHMAHPWDENWDVGQRLGKGGQGLTHLATRKTDPSAQGALKNKKDAQARARMHREVAS